MDFTVVDKNIVIPVRGEVRACGAIQINDDDFEEEAEAFLVKISAPVGVSVEDGGIRTIIIKDNDGMLACLIAIV